MNANEYVYRASTLALSQFEIEKRGLPLNVNNRFILKLRDVPIKNTTTDNEIIKLIYNYVISPHIVYTLTFDDECIEEGDRIYFGTTNYHRLYISKDSGEIRGADFEEENEVIFVAKDDKHFFDSLFLVLKLSSDLLKGKISIEDSNATNSTFAECVEMAGGRKYRFFYQSLGFLI